MKTHFLNCIAISLVALSFASVASAQKIRVVRDAASSKILTIKVATNLPDGDLADKIEKDGSGKSTLAESPDKIRQAFVFCVSSGSTEVTSPVCRVFVTDLGIDKTYEIKGEELYIEAGRPVDELKWIDNNTLSYERWTGPHFGHRYVVNVKLMKQTGGFVLSDQ